jgi:hypothetical protein
MNYGYTEDVRRVLGHVEQVNAGHWLEEPVAFEQQRHAGLAGPHPIQSDLPSARPDDLPL